MPTIEARLNVESRGTIVHASIIAIERFESRNDSDQASVSRTIRFPRRSSFILSFFFPFLFFSSAKTKRKSFIRTSVRRLSSHFVVEFRVISQDRNLRGTGERRTAEMFSSWQWYTRCEKDVTARVHFLSLRSSGWPHFLSLFPSLFKTPIF